MSDEPAGTLTALHEELLAYVGGRLHDDAALLLLRKPAASHLNEDLVTPAPGGSVPGTAPLF